MFRPNPASGVPIYLQLMEQVKHGIETGALRPGEQLPGIRPLAEELVINPNTVAKAYRELEHEGVIELRHGAGAFVSGDARSKKLTDNLRAGQTIVASTVERLRARGVTDDEIRRMFEAELVGPGRVTQDRRSSWLMHSSWRPRSCARPTDAWKRCAGLDLQIPAGSICGLLGRNGAGKTTTLKILLGMVRPTSGRRARARPRGGRGGRERGDPAPHRVRERGQGPLRLHGGRRDDPVHRRRSSRAGAPTSRQRYVRTLRAAGGPQDQGAVARDAHQARVAARAVPRRGAADPRRADLRPRSRDGRAGAAGAGGARRARTDDRGVVVASDRRGRADRRPDRDHRSRPRRLAGALDELRARYRRIQLVFDGDAPEPRFRAPGCPARAAQGPGADGGVERRLRADPRGGRAR